MKVFMKIQEGEGIYESYIKFVKSIGDRWRRDNIVLTILLAIVLFTPDRPDVEDTEKVE